jgi:hypothetical protein
MEVEEILDRVIKKLSDLIFEVEMLKGKVKQTNYTIEVKNNKGEVIKKVVL